MSGIKRFENGKDTASKYAIRSTVAATPGDIVSMAEGQSNSEEQTSIVFGCWNVGGGFDRKCKTIAEEMCKADVRYLGLTETKVKFGGEKKIDRDCWFMFKGVDSGHARAGVGLMLQAKDRNNVKDLNGVHDRLLVSHIREGGKSIALFVFYGPNENSHKVDKVELYEKLQNKIDDTKEDNIIIVGDFNARVGTEAEKWDHVIGKAGEDKVTDSGELLLQLCVANDLVIVNTFFEHEERKKFTRYAEKNGREEKSIIDYCIIRRSVLSLVLDAQAHDETERISDHRLVTVKMQNQQKPTEGEGNRAREHESDYQIKYYLLRQEDKQAKYQKLVSNLLSWNRKQNLGDLENKWSKLKNALLKAAAEVCGTSRPCCNRRGTSWWTDDVASAVKNKNEAWRDLCRKRDDALLSGRYKDERRAAKKIVKKAKRSSWKQFGNTLESPRNENQKLFFHVMKKVNEDADYPKQNNLKSENGSLLTDRKEIVERWREYFEERFALFEDTDLTKPEAETGESISRNELQKSLQRMKAGRSAGRDGITSEMIKYMGEKGQEKLLDVINTAWECKEVPRDWKETIVFPFYRNGDKSLCESYGAISLLSIAAKVYARILEQRIRHQTEAQLNEAQCGCRQNRSKNDHAFVIRQLIELSHLRRTALHLCHLNLERVLGKLALSVVMDSLAGKDVSACVRLAVLGLYEKRINYVRTRNTLSTAFETGFSVRPQDSLSSYLSILVLDDVFKSYQSRTRKSDCNFLPVSETAYFDQVVLLATTRKELQFKLNVWCEELGKRRLHLCAEDARVMSVSADEDVVALEIGGSAVAEVPCFSYSGLCIENTRQTAGELNRRIGDAGRLFNAVKHAKVGNRGLIGKRTKEALFNAEFVERLARGSATRWQSAKSDVDRMKSMENRYLRLSTTPAQRRYDMRFRAEPKSVARVRQRQLGYAERVSDMEEDRAPRSVLRTLQATRKPPPSHSWRRDVAAARGARRH